MKLFRCERCSVQLIASTAFFKNFYIYLFLTVTVRETLQFNYNYRPKKKKSKPVIFDPQSC